MKRIKENKPPKELIAWTHAKAKNVDGKLMNWGYSDMPADLRRKVKLCLIREQGALCCYTGRRIDDDTSHIEHLKPQEKCVKHEDTDYSNILAAYPSANFPGRLAYGAHKKANWYDPILFIHPLRDDCEKRITYKDDGSIKPTRSNDKAAIETITKLDLDNDDLKNLRSTAIHTALFEEQLSKGDVQKLYKAMDSQNAKGQLREYCFAIKQACERYLKRFN